MCHGPAMLKDEIENLVAHLFAGCGFDVISETRFDVIVPGWRLPVRAFRELEKVLSATPELTLSAAGDNYVAAFFDGHYKGQSVQVYLRTAAVVAVDGS